MTLFHSPWAFFLIIPLLFGIYFYFKRKKQSRFKISNIKILEKTNKTLKVYLKNLPIFLMMLSTVLLIYALARPQKADERERKTVDGIDILIALDISDSMLIEDMKPDNRLEAAKQVIDEFIDNRSSDRIGLVVFSGEAYTRIPLTVDYSVLKSNLKEVQTSRNIKLGTAIGVALATSVGRIKDSDGKSKVIILLTDGENNSGTIAPETALEIAKKENIKIYTIGIGKDGQAQLPVYSKDIFGRKVKSYRPMHSKVNVKLLKRLADETGGIFYRVNETDNLERVFGKIDQLEKTKVEVQSYTKYAELFPNWISYGSLCFFIFMLFNWLFLRRYP